MGGLIRLIMKKFLTLSFVLLAFTSFSQKHEVGINYRYGVPTQNFKIFEPDGITRYHYLEARSVSDFGIIFKYKYKIWERAGIYISGGLEYSKSKHYQPIYAIGNASMHLDNIVINKSRYTLNWFGIHKQFNLFENKLIVDLGCDVVDKFYSSKIDNYSSDYIKNTNPGDQWIDYSYNLTAHYDEYYENNFHIDGSNFKYVFLDWSLQLKFLLKQNLYFDFGFNYTRNNIFFYDYTYSVRYYIGGSTTPTNIYNHGGLTGLFDPKYAVRDHYLYLHFGMSYKFGKKK